MNHIFVPNGQFATEEDTALGRLTIKKNKYIVARHIHGASFLIDISDNYSGDKCALYEINETGMFIWKKINGERSVNDLAKLLKEAIIDEVDYELVRNDVSEFVETLVIKKFAEAS